MLTRSAQHALGAFAEDWSTPSRARRFLGAWNVGLLVSSRPVDQILQDRLDGVDNGQIVVTENPERQPRYRFERGVVLHSLESDAVEADLQEGFRTAHWLSATGSGPEAGYSTAKIIEVAESQAFIQLTYRADGVAPLTIAHTYHPGWRAGIDGHPTSIHRTSLGMMGLFLPPGEHLVELRFREAATLPAIVISLLTATGLALGVVLSSARLGEGQ